MTTARSARNFIASTISVACFVAGSGIALSFSWAHLAPVVEAYGRIPALLSTDHQSLEYSCRDSDCVTCISGLLNTTHPIVFTGGSAWRYALDFPMFSAAMPRPVVNCIRNDSRIDSYRSFFAFAPVNNADHLLFHGYNAWAINSPGTWAGDRSASFYEVRRDPVPVWVESLPAWIVPAATLYANVTAPPQLALLYAHVLFSRGIVESPYQWRMYLRARFPLFAAHDLSYWPLSKEEHLRRRLVLMKRWFDLSAYVQSFIIGVDTLRPAEEIVERHEQFFAAMAPTHRFVFFQAPYLSAVFPDHVKDVMRESKKIMLDSLARHPDVRHVEIDYAACGLGPLDFWHPAQMSFDIAHVNNDAAAKLTPCVINALKSAHLDDLLSAPR